jgi:hypothetical protein
VPVVLDVHFVMDNYDTTATTRHLPSENWLARHLCSYVNLTHYIKVQNDDPKPFVWSKTAYGILASVERFRLQTSSSRLK